MPSSDLSRRRFHRWTSLYGQAGEIDAQGRVLIPPQLRDTAVMQGDVVVLGSGIFSKSGTVSASSVRPTPSS